MVFCLLKTVIANDDRNYTEESCPKRDFPLCWEIFIPDLNDFYKRALHFKVGLTYLISYFQTALNKTSRLVFIQSIQPKESMA